MNKNNNELLYEMRHSAEHVLMHAMRNLKYKFHMAMGPATDEGFYFDFQLLNGSISEEDFPKIEKEIQKLIKLNLPITEHEIDPNNARNLFGNNPYKQEWIDEIVSQQSPLTIYWTGEPNKNESFVDLCKGPHVESTGEIGVVKLLSVAGAYWRGDEKNIMLTRIYGTAFKTQKEMEEYLENIEEAKRRDHKKIGKELELFMFHETAPGSPYWLPKGLEILNELTRFWRVEHRKRGYLEIATPLVNKKELWETSGHWDHYKDDMFIADMGENEIYGIKPMNCPNAMLVFASKTRSYKDLPLRLSDTDILHRYERSGTLNGLLRVRSFRQDDSHNFVTEDQIKDEYSKILEIADLFYGVFGLDFKYRLGTRPEKFMGDVESWNKAESELKIILEKSGREYFIEEGDGAFYGPKVDIVMQDAIGRDWQMGTIQLDFQIPKRFKLKYIDNEGKEKTPVVIHRVIYGSLERFIGILIEHFAGAFPVWLSPVQVQILTVSEGNVDYGREILSYLLDNDIRAELEDSDETIGNKIRKAQEQKTPYMLIIGNNEKESKTISVRNRNGEKEQAISLKSFTNKVKTNIISKSLEV
ncbi:threonine--tRNA ligase [candidate division WWE3 bacterium CG_4_9_14_3_um_filter_34_6]|uniref:Threonine--tRNA ligase n=1 Tax=candidate division WWE3 bacterium CG_4_9_14_3_um_filter_34_6 TaxID=1975079 RepID=A0A2M7X2T5_UNCKA|nr:MAG: threonine--tRNA ligase [candidate division WWE3 bacterium CG_4_9_14_3_um_filter_34_6]